MEKGKSTNGLMKHIRDKHNIQIKGSKHKTDLLNMGYYHGYKRFRFIKDVSSNQNFTNFDQIKAIHKFDTAVKALIYPLITHVETGQKNRTIDYLVTNSNPDIEAIFRDRLNGYKDYHKINDYKKYRQRLKERLDLRKNIDETIAYYYGKNDSLSHFIHNSRPIPLWGFFEAISFGQYGHFLSALNKDDRLNLCDFIGLTHSGLNADGRLLEQIVFALTGLRNATMHNAPVYDANFNKETPPKKLKTFLNGKLQITISFDTIIDYIILLLYMMRLQSYSKRELNIYISNFRKIKDVLYQSVPKSTFDKIVGANSIQKLEKLENIL